MSQPLEREMHQGEFTIELSDTAKTSHIPQIPSVTIVGRKVHVTIGRASVVMGGLQFYAQEQPFAFNWNSVNRVLDSKNQVLWKNHNYKG